MVNTGGDHTNEDTDNGNRKPLSAPNTDAKTWVLYHCLQQGRHRVCVVSWLDYKQQSHNMSKCSQGQCYQISLKVTLLEHHKIMTDISWK